MKLVVASYYKWRVGDVVNVGSDRRDGHGPLLRITEVSADGRCITLAKLRLRDRLAFAWRRLKRGASR